MKTVFIDYETYYDKEYSLRKMTPVQYVLDHRFECIGCAVKEGLDGESYWVDGVDLPLFFADLNPRDTMLVSHNALFDACITAWRFNFHPRLTADTLSIARATIGHETKSLSLANVALKLDIGVKGGTVHKVEGMGSAAIKAAGLYNEYIQYALNDVELCAAIYRTLVVEKRLFPVKELAVMDMVIRCAIEPQMQLDQNVLALHLHNIKTRKQELLAQVGIDKTELMSNDKFAQALRNLGVEPPTKMSILTGKESYAFAKTDPAFMELLDHDDPQVQTLASARLGLKSTLEETRTERFTSIARLTWPGKKQGLMPMPLRYSGAHTHRLSGDWSLNVQNMPRGGELRRALIAPPGHVVLAADSSQIEARVVAWISGQLDLIEQFARGEDVYSSFASKVFGREINKKNDPAERFIGKTAILGLGYGLGWTKFQRTVKMQSKAQAGKLIDLTDEEAINIVQTYRTSYSAIPALWRILSDNISVISSGKGSFAIGPCEFKDRHITLPNGLRLSYHDLKFDNNEWAYTYAGKPKRLYGGALLENIVQALARIVVMDTAARLRVKLAMYDVQLALQVHDELVYVVPEDIAKVCEKITLEEMSVRPSWAPTLPLAAEASYGKSYGDAK